MTAALRGPFRFDPVRHAYTVGDVYVPGITRILRAYRGDDVTMGAEYLARGRAVHAATLLRDLGDDVPPLPPEWQPYYDAYPKFREAVPCEWKGLEQARVNRALRYAGTPDRWGLVAGYPAVLEIKTGYPAVWHGWQLAAQDLLLPAPHRVRRRFAVYLHKDGRPKLKEYNDPTDYVRFLDALDAFGGGDDGEDDDGEDDDYQD